MVTVIVTLAIDGWAVSQIHIHSLQFALRSVLTAQCSYKSGRCAVELYHASHLWYPPFYTSPWLPAPSSAFDADGSIDRVGRNRSTTGRLAPGPIARRLTCASRLGPGEIIQSLQ